eukprot:2992766-Pleurochrysis_carterae.AAC.1
MSERQGMQHYFTRLVPSQFPNSCKRVVSCSHCADPKAVFAAHKVALVGHGELELDKHALLLVEPQVPPDQGNSNPVYRSQGKNVVCEIITILLTMHFCKRQRSEHSVKEFCQGYATDTPIYDIPCKN